MKNAVNQFNFRSALSYTVYIAGPPPLTEPGREVATLVVLLRDGKALPGVTGLGDLRTALQNLAADVRRGRQTTSSQGEKPKSNASQEAKKRIDDGDRGEAHLPVTQNCYARSNALARAPRSVLSTRQVLSTDSIHPEVATEDNLLGAELLWTPEETNDVMDRDDLFLNFPELINV